jgi:hypothetical protein
MSTTYFFFLLFPRFLADPARTLRICSERSAGVVLAQRSLAMLDAFWSGIWIV